MFFTKNLIVLIIFSIIFLGGWVEGECADYTLSLEKTTQLALQNNFDIQLAKYDAWIARTDKKVAESIYDTIFEAEVQYRDNQKKRTSTIIGTQALDNDYNIGLSKKLPTGTTLEVDLMNSRNFTDSVFTTSPLTHDSTLGMTITQELGKNFFGLRDRWGIKIALVDIENSEYTSLEKIEEEISDVQKAYWDLVLQIERVKIEQDMVDQAKRLYDLHQEKLKDGLVEMPDVLASQANYEKSKNDLIFAENQVHAKENVLRLLLNISDDHIRILPTDTFALPELQRPLAPTLKKAFENRRDYKRAVNDVKSKDIQLTVKKNNLWPEINLTASLERNGLGDHFKPAVENITREDNPNLFAGLTINIPLENRAARGAKKAAELEKAKTLVALKLLERKITLEVVDQVRDSNVFAELADNSEHIANLQAQKLEEEGKRFRQGRSDTDTLIRFQKDVVQARAEAAAAKHRYHAAMVDLETRSGVLLGKYFDLSAKW